MARVGHNPLFLAFDDIELMLERVGKISSEGYPPYNIECDRDESGEIDYLRIVLAVAGFEREQLEIILQNNELTIRGKQLPEGPRDYLHRGIARRKFKRSYILGEGMKVESANLDNGLLTIELKKPGTDKQMKSIEIISRQ
ncbi:MAG: Hsp20 family protein [Hyphomicrobiales bacterium]|nr:Hsp20 family protein [Hyphomicrobiales bacterium]